MRHYTPKIGIKETSNNVRGFVKNHMDIFWLIFKPLAPYIAVLYLLDVVATYFLYGPEISEIAGSEEENKEFGLGGLVASYFFTCLAISWHRVVIHGPDNFEPMNPFRPQKSDLAFIAMGIFLFLVPFIGVFTIVFVSSLIKFHGALWLIIPFIIGAIYFVLRASFYFPAKATGNSLTLKQALSMTKGYVWKFVAAYFLAALRITVAMILFIFITVLILGGGLALFKSLFDMNISLPLIEFSFGYILALPIILYFQPVLTVIGVTVLSNFYQYALQNSGSSYDRR